MKLTRTTLMGTPWLCLAATALLMQGCRRDDKTKAKGLGTSSCQPTAGAALLLGQTMIGWRVYDVMRAIELLGTQVAPIVEQEAAASGRAA